MVVWGKGGKIIEIPFVIGARMECMYLKPFANGAGQIPFAIGAETVYCTKQAHKAHTNNLGKGPTNDYYC